MTLRIPPVGSAASPYAGLIGALAQVRSQPLWDRYHRITTREPRTPGAAHLWSWSDMEPLIERSVNEVSMEDAERRVLLLANPGQSESVATLGNLSGGLQTLMPGEVARSHRHSLAALRFVMQGQGAMTRVNGEPCPMEEGDLILTPSWTWHEHTHPGRGRMVWFDGLDLPLAHHLDAMFFEIEAAGLQAVDPPPTRAALAPGDFVDLFPDSGALPAASADRAAYGRFRYSGRRAEERVCSAPPRADGSRWLRYVDAVSAGPALPTLDCYMLGLDQGKAMRKRRSTSAAICVVAAGEGQSHIGDRTLAWKRNDVFTVPHWQWVTHCASSAQARLFLMTDREFLAGMGYLREEESDS